MKVITEKQKTKIIKMLAAIYYTAVHWRDEEWVDFVKCITENCAEIAYELGGERTMSIDLPSCVISLENQLKKHKDGET